MQEKKIYTKGYLERFAPESAYHPSEELQSKSWARADQSNLNLSQLESLSFELSFCLCLTLSSPDFTSTKSQQQII